MTLHNIRTIRALLHWNKHRAAAHHLTHGKVGLTSEEMLGITPYVAYLEGLLLSQVGPQVIPGVTYLKIHL